jgi:CubicO group peptidase (beta-lactamase class C family)
MHRLIPPLLAVVLSLAIAAQKQSPSPLSDYVGTYVDKPGHMLEIVAGKELFAVIDGAKYKLTPAGVDVFTNAIGQKIPFRRNDAREVTGYVESGKFHPRVSRSVTPEAVALLRPRPPGEDSPAHYHYQPPIDLHDGIAVGSIADSELGESTANAIVGAILTGAYKDLHSVLLYLHGKLVLEEYFYGYNARRPHQLRSATKSVVGALAGIAVDRGSLSGVDERVLPLMNYTGYSHPDTRKSEMTLGDFLTMSSGLACNDHDPSSPGRETLIDNAPDWVKATLDLPMIHNPGSMGLYCSGGVAVVGRMIENAVHMRLPDFAQANLFGRLGISRTSWRWNYTLTNGDKEFSQIHLRPRDMLKLGVLFANNGRWQGRQVISPSWVRRSLAKQSMVDGTAYGYFWWHPWLRVETPSGARRVYMSAAQGNGGQKIYLLPQFDFIAVFTGGAYNRNSPPNRIMVKIILPKLLSARADKEESAPTE